MQLNSTDHPLPTIPRPAAEADEEQQQQSLRPEEAELQSPSGHAVGVILTLPEYEGPIEDDRDDASDSGVGEEVASTTTSLSSSVQEYVHRYGRRYQTDVNWFVPNDKCEQDRMGLRHVLSILTLEWRLLWSWNRPDSTPRILDIGTGTGLWAIDIADQYPGGEVVGTDISPIQHRMVPPNCTFVVDDAEATWEVSKKYNIVHIRYMEGAFTDWPWIFEQAMAVLEPGGIIEVHGTDFRPYAQEGEVPEVIQTWITKLYELTEKRGTPIDVTDQYATWMRAAGFENVQKREFAQPLGPWAKDQRQKDIGVLNLEATLNEIEGYTLEPFVEGGWSEEAATVLIACVRHEYQQNYRTNQLRTKLVVATGRKPGGTK